MAFLASLRSTIAYQTNGSTISTGSIYQATTGGVPLWSNTLVSSIVSIGASTNQTYTTMSQGNFSTSTNWISTLTGRSSTIGVSMSANAQTQMVVTQVSTTTSIQYTSTLGTTWTTLSGASGLPSATITNYSAEALSGNGQYGILAAYGGYLYTTANSGASWMNTNPNTPAIYLPFETAPVNGAIGGTTLTVSPSVPGLVPGIVGRNALNLVNATGSGNGTNYIRGIWTVAGTSSFTWSFWLNMQTVTEYQNILMAFNGAGIYIQSSGILYFFAGGVNIAYTPFPLAINKWYNITVIFQPSGTGYLYVNNILIPSVATCPASAGSSTGLFSIGCADTNIIYCFNGYIDDLKIYNSAIIPTPMVPQNWSYTAVSNTGQYMLATATNSGLYLSSNYGSTWSQVTSAMLYAAWTNASVSATGQYLLANSPLVMVQPNITGLTSTVATIVIWQKNGITWTGTSSSNNDLTQSVFKAFNNATGDAWLSNNATPRYNADGTINANAASTTVSGVGIIRGEYLQLQSSVPLVMYSFALGRGLNPEAGNAPKTYYIIGSNDGTTWYTLQTGTTNIGALSGSSSYVLINQSGVQILSGTSSGNITTAATSYATTPYTYFRLVGTSLINGGGSTYMEIGEWFINFQSGGQTYSTNYGSTWDTALPLYGIVQPQLTGLAASTWNQSGVNWIASSSPVNTGAGGQNYYAFDNNPANRWVPNSGSVYTTSGNTSGVYTTILGGIGSVQGDYLQLQSSVPLIMSSYQFATGYILTTARIPKMFYIVGSNNGTDWYPIQSATGTGNPSSTNLSLIPGSIRVNLNGTQTYGLGTLATTTYATTANAYTYFRLIVVTIYTVSADTIDIGEWFLTFTTGLQTTQSLSPSGLTALTGYTAATISPQKTDLVSSGTNLTTSPWQSGGVTWIASASSVYHVNFPVSYAFNNSYASLNSWVSTTTSAYNSSGVYIGTTSTNIVNDSGAVLGEWLQIQSSVPLQMYSYNFASGNTANIVPKVYYIVGSDNGTDWYIIQTVNLGATCPFTSTNIAAISPIIINQSGSQIMNGGTAVTFTPVTAATSTSTFTYFRLIVNSIFGTSLATELGEWFINFTIPSNTSLYNIVSPITNLLTGSVVTAGTIPGTITGSAVSNTGQYMVIVTNNTSGNNVYYSTNTGATFTGITVGSLAMTSAAISYDGSYITVTNATTVYQLNNNNSGYTIAVGNQAGQINQSQNAIAIGNQAGYKAQGLNSISIENNAGSSYQIANSIILNASGSTVNAISQGFYVAPILPYNLSISSTFSLLGYGTDNQVIQTGLIVNKLGNVGIGTTAPGGTLDVRGTLLVYSTTAQPLILWNPSGPYDWGVGPQNDGTFKILAGPYGGVQLPWTATSWSASSDIRIKEHVESLTNCLTKIISLRPVSFYYINRPSTITNKTLGLIAQEVKTIIPEVIHPYTDKDTQDTYYSITYTELIPILIGAIKEQDYTIQNQSTHIDVLQSQTFLLQSELSTATTTITTLQSQLSDILQRLTNANL